MTSAVHRRASAVLVALGVCLASAPAAAQSARVRYETARRDDAAARAQLAKAPDDGAPAARQAAIAGAQRVIARYEAIVRRYPTSGYSDNALLQAADLARSLYVAYGRASHRAAVGRYVAWLTREYPASSLRSEARTVLRAVEEARAARVAAAARVVPRAAAPPPRPTPASAPAPADAAPAAAGASGPAVLQAIERTVLDDVVRLTLPLDREVPFAHETLADPPRAFIDLHGVEAAPSLVASILGGEAPVHQVRVGRQPAATRVVLDLAAPAKVSVFALYNPFRVVIDTERGPYAMVRVPVPADGPVVVVDERGALPAAVPAGTPTAGPAGPPVAAGATPLPPLEDPAPRPVESALLVGVSADPPVPPPAVPAANADGSFSLARQLGLGVSRIVIDPGHGGHDPGTRGHGATEAAVVLDIALRLERLLQKEPGLDVVLTRRTDVFIPLQQRTAIANKEGADLFLSIHANASRNPSARGVETYFLSFASSPDAEAVAARENATSDRAMHNLPNIVRAIALNNKLDESRDLAGMVQDAMTTRLARVNAGIRSRGVKKAPFVVLIGAGMPSVLAEVAFLTNRSEAALVRTPAYRQRIAEALHAAVLRYRRALKRQTAVATAQ
jgi:N-acetylmuramoyl-L-alanine amidase